MKLLKKLGIALFSLMLFCGMSMTVFAMPGVSTKAYVQDDNNGVVVGIECKNGAEEYISYDVFFYDSRGNLLDSDNVGDKAKELKTYYDNTPDGWEKIKVNFFYDGKLIKTKILERETRKYGNVRAFGYIANDGDVVVKMVCDDGEFRELKHIIAYYDEDGNKLDEKRVTNGNTKECIMYYDGSTVPNKYKKIIIKYYVDGKGIGRQSLER